MTINHLDLDEFRDGGWLLEVNRLFFHPRGLALSAKFEDGHVTALDGIWDYREDPEGVMFGDDQFQPEDRAKADAIEQIRQSKVEARALLGCGEDGIQPIPALPRPTPEGA